MALSSNASNDSVEHARTKGIELANEIGAGHFTQVARSLRRGCDISLLTSLHFQVEDSGIGISPEAQERLLQFSSTLLSRVIDFFRECGVAVGTMSGRSQQPRPDRFQDLLQRQTRSFFLPQGRWSG